MVATFPGRTHGLGLVTEPLLSELQIDRLLFAQINLWATLLGAAFCSPAGWATDRFGVRRVTVAMLLATGASAAALGFTSSALAPLLLILTLTRGFGQSALSVCSITAMGKWFTHRSGPAMGWYAFLMGILFASAFGVVGYLVREQGWRVAWFIVAAVVVVVVVPLVVVFLPENSTTKPVVTAARPAIGLSLRDALRTQAFWVFAGSTALYGLVSSGLGLFQQAVLAERGFDQQTYHHLLVGSSLVSLAAQLACGWLSLRVAVGRLTGVALLLHALALAWLPFVVTRMELWCFAILMGAAGGVVVVVFFAVWGQLFGPAHLGRIQAAAQMLTVLASAVGPLVFAQCHALKGSYAPVLFALAFVALLFAVAAWRVRLPLAGSLPSASPAP